MGAERLVTSLESSACVEVPVWANRKGLEAVPVVAAGGIADGDADARPAPDLVGSVDEAQGPGGRFGRRKDRHGRRVASGTGPCGPRDDGP
mgnify:CR=1 FL=1